MGASLWQHNKGVFARAHKFIADEVDRTCHNRAIKMHGALRYRRMLLGEPAGTRYPKGDGTKASQTGRESEPHSYLAWTIKPGRKHAHYSVYNGHHNAVDNYPYPFLLLYGNGWNTKGFGPYKRLVSSGDGRHFSTQMPNGISPWMVRQRKLLKSELGIIADIWAHKQNRGKSWA